jgi:GTP-binding protein
VSEKRITVSQAAHAPIVALVGRPNVGKSTLFNRLTGGHDAIVEDEPGVTRDRRYGVADWCGKVFRVVDTGGLMLDAYNEQLRTVDREVFRQAMQAVKEADLIVFVADARKGVVPEDRAAAEVLRKAGKVAICAANKVDKQSLEADAQELYELGFDNVLSISAQHGRGVGELCDAILEKLPDAPTLVELQDEAVRPIKIALVGRPNAGKSSMLNRFVGTERMIVDAEAGTTRDPVETAVELGGRPYIIIDTAGIRRRAKVSVAMEKIAVAMAEKAVERCDVCVLMIDGEAGLAEQDAKVAGICEEKGRALVICFNKLDLIDGATEQKLIADVKRQLQFVPWARVVFASAKTGKGAQRILDAVQAAYAGFTRRVTTGALNRWFETIVEKHPPSLFRGHPVKLYFIQQPKIAPPTFVLSVNNPDGVHFSYRRYLQNQLREEFDLWGTPVRIVCRGRSSPDAKKVRSRRKRVTPGSEDVTE